MFTNSIINLLLCGLTTQQCIVQCLYLYKFLDNKSNISNLVNDIKITIAGMYPLALYSKKDIDKMKPVEYMDRCHVLNTQNARDLDEILFYNCRLTDFLIHYKIYKNRRIFKEKELISLNSYVDLLELFYSKYYEQMKEENKDVNSISLKKLEGDVKFIKKAKILLSKYYELYKNKKPILLIESIGYFSPMLFGVLSMGFLGRSMYYMMEWVK